jgi:hypothetical protein
VVVVGLGLGEFVDLVFRIVEEMVVGLCQELKDGLMSYLIASLVEESMWGFRVLICKRA